MLALNSRYAFAAIVSLILALGLATLSQAAPVESADRSDELQKLVNELGGHIGLVMRTDVRHAELQREFLRSALNAWNASGRSEDDFAQMKSWLESSIDASLPGSRHSMPTIPTFSEQMIAEVVPAPTDDQTASEAPAISAESPTEASPRETFAKADPTETKPVVVAPVQPEQQTATVWQRHPAAEPLNLTDPFGDENTGTESRVAMRPAAMTTTARTRVQVNTLELGARVKGYAQGVRGVEARLLANPNMTFDELVGVIREMRQLSNQYDMLSLYLDTGAMGENHSSSGLPTLDPAKRMATQQVKQLEEAGEIDRKLLTSMKTALITL